MNKSKVAAELLALVLPTTGHDPDLDDKKAYGPRGGFRGYTCVEKHSNTVTRLPDRFLTAAAVAKNIRHGFHYGYDAGPSKRQFFPWPEDAWHPTTAHVPATADVKLILKAYSDDALFSEVCEVYSSHGPERALEYLKQKLEQ